MTDFKVGDKIAFRGVLGDGRERIVTGIGRDHLLYVPLPGGKEFHAAKSDVTKVEPFFEVGETYAFPTTRHCRYSIVQVRGAGGHRFAWAEVPCEESSPRYLDMVSLDEDDFRIMVKA